MMAAKHWKEKRGGNARAWMHDQTTHRKGLMEPKNLWVIVFLAVAAMVSGCGFSQPPPFDPKRIEQIQIENARDENAQPRFKGIFHRSILGLKLGFNKVVFKFRGENGRSGTPAQGDWDCF